MKFLSVVTPPTDIYHDCSTQNMFWEEKFTPVTMESSVSRNIRKHRETNNGEQYIILNIFHNIDCLDNR